METTGGMTTGTAFGLKAAEEVLCTDCKRRGKPVILATVNEAGAIQFRPEARACVLTKDGLSITCSSCKQPQLFSLTW